MAEDADLILYVVDSSRPLDDNDEDIIELLSGRKSIVIYNKTDLGTSGKYGKTPGKNGKSGNSCFDSRRKRNPQTGRRDQNMFFKENSPLMMKYISQMQDIKLRWKKPEKA